MLLKRVHLIRHGETSANALGVMQGSGIDLPLSETGRRQAALLGLAFKDTPVDVIVVSALQRTMETASQIKQFHPHAEIVQLPQLNEIGWGEYEGKLPTPALKDLWRQWEAGRFDASAPGGESPLEVELRSVPALYNVIASHPSKTNFAVVIHGRLIRIMLASILNRNLSFMNTYQHFNTCINTLDVAVLDENESKDARLKKEFVEAITPRIGNSNVATVVVPAQDLAPPLNVAAAEMISVSGATGLVPSGTTTPVGGLAGAGSIAPPVSSSEHRNWHSNPVAPLIKDNAAPLSNANIQHPDNLVFRAVVLNDTTHLATFKAGL
ncbi:hypothetical protein HDU78_011449 [Chytriomyces hyalinus]|nr:hypothetical protein HDU77_011516 [Chytriomyces hyalinus]KAJ3248596.1 hypothetical protein HDU78_011449 [Chytriomyces hyalinus]